MKQQSRFRIKPIEIVTGVSVATGIMMLLSVSGALLINKDLVPENSIIHMAMAIHFLSVCISSFALKLIYECDNALQTIIISFAYFLILLAVHLTIKADFHNILVTLLSAIGGAIPALTTDILKKKGKNKGYKYRFR